MRPIAPHFYPGMSRLNVLSAEDQPVGNRMALLLLSANRIFFSTLSYCCRTKVNSCMIIIELLSNDAEVLSPMIEESCYFSLVN